MTCRRRTLDCPGAHNAVEVPASPSSRGERVALIADEASREVAASLEQALADAGRAGDAVLIESRGRAPDDGRRRARCSTRSERADAGILCVQPQEGELPARMAIVGVVERRRIRYAHMVGVTPQIMREGMRADYRLVDRLSQQLCERMPHATSLTRRDRRPAPTLPRPSIRRSRGSRPAGSSIRATGRTCRPARCSRRRRSVDGIVRLRRHGRRLLQRQVRQPRRDAADAGDSRRPAVSARVRARAISSTTSGTTATPTRTATASASWRSAPTSACAR